MALLKRRKVNRKIPEVKDGKFASGKRAGRPTVSPGEVAQKVSMTLPPSKVEELKLIARVHFRGSMSACVTKLLNVKLQEFWQELEAEWEKKNASRPHADLIKKRRPRKKKEETKEDDLGFVVVK